MAAHVELHEGAGRAGVHTLIDRQGGCGHGIADCLGGGLLADGLAAKGERTVFCRDRIQRGLAGLHSLDDRRILCGGAGGLRLEAGLALLVGAPGAAGRIQVTHPLLQLELLQAVGAGEDGLILGGGEHTGAILNFPLREFTGERLDGDAQFVFLLLPEGGVEGILHAVAEEVDSLAHFAVQVTLAVDAAVALLHVRRRPWDVELVGGDHEALHIDAGP